MKHLRQNQHGNRGHGRDAEVNSLALALCPDMADRVCEFSYQALSRQQEAQPLF